MDNTKTVNQSGLTDRRKVWLARGIAMAADAVQLGLMPVTALGVFSPANAAIDVGVAILLSWLVGWHIAFLPGFVIEMIPAANLAPTWTIAVMIATRKAGLSGETTKIQGQ